MEDIVTPDLAKKPSKDYEPKKPRAYISALCQVALGLVVGALPGFSLIAPLQFFHTSFTLNDMPFVLYQGFWVSLIMVGVLWLICYFLPARRTVAFSMLPTLALSLVLFYFVSSFLNYITQPVTMPEQYLLHKCSLTRQRQTQIQNYP